MGTMAQVTTRRLAFLALLLLLPALGLLTWWAWDGMEDSLHSEAHQMRKFEEVAAAQVVNNLGSELFHLFYTFNLGISEAPTTTDDWPRTIEQWVSTYRSQAHYPGLLTEVVLVADPPVGPRRWVRWSADGWIPGDRPAWIPESATLFEPSADPVIDADQSYLVFRLPSWKDLRQALVVRWSMVTVVDTIVPALAEKAFVNAEAPTVQYRVEVHRVTQRWGSPLPTGWDLNVPLVPRMRFSEWLHNYLDRSLDAPRSGNYTEPVTRWMLEVRRDPDGVNAVVEAQRGRNLWLVSGLVGVLLLGLALMLLSLRGLLQMSDRERSFSSLVSHELKTPLAAIRSLSENLADGVATRPERVKDYGHALLDQSRRLNELVENILALAVLDSSKGHLARETFDLVETAWEIGQRHSLAVGGDRGPRLVRGNRAAVRAALDNLATNALRHGVKDGEEALVAMGLHSRMRWGRVWTGVSVTDHGPGLTATERRRLFEPFHRGRRAGDRQTPGGGVGLSLVRATMRQLGGRIEVRPVQGGGLTFTLWLLEGGRR